MKGYTKPHPTIVTIFGAAGDLAWRKLIPAMYNLQLKGRLPEKFRIIGLDRKEMDNASFCDHLKEGVNSFCRRGRAKSKEWKSFAEKLTYVKADVHDRRSFKQLADLLEKQDRSWGDKANRIFYLAVPPNYIEPIAIGLDTVKLAGQQKRHRIVVEKPFGHDLNSARALNRKLIELFEEVQIYRIDHYLGKETVQNILAFRFANSMYEPIWDRRYIDHVQITVAEDMGIGHRGTYYEGAGALRDMVQNHLSQVLCLIAMEPPVSYDADEIRNKKVDVLRAIRRIERDRVNEIAARGQYGEGWLKGKHAVAYRAEEDVDAQSNRETFAAVKYFIDNWRWQDVPFYLRTGKRMAYRTSEVVITMRSVPHQSFPSSAIVQPQPNRLIIRIQPEEGIIQQFMAKAPGETMHLAMVDMKFFYREAFRKASPEAYETLLLDVIHGDATQFMRADQLEASWEIITPILDVWEEVEPPDFPNYAAGTRGPECAEGLIARDGRSWVLPDMKQSEPP